MFDKSAYKKWDETAKNAVLKFLNDNLLPASYKEEDYGADIMTDSGVAHEVEVKAVWSGVWNKTWTDVQIPYRKVKLLERYDQIYFWILNKSCSVAWLIKGEDMTEENTRILHAGRGDEKFFFVPIDKCRKVILTKNYRE